MLNYRRIHIENDKDFVLEMHSLGSFESDATWARSTSLFAYREHWRKTSQPEAFLAALRKSLEDPRTVAEIWEEEGKPVGFLWLRFYEIEGYNITVAEIEDIEVTPSHQRLGIGTMMVQHAEAMARENGAHLLRSQTGIENAASQNLHARAGFSLYRMLYEKVLDGEHIAGAARS